MLPHFFEFAKMCTHHVRGAPLTSDYKAQIGDSLQKKVKL